MKVSINSRFLSGPYGGGMQFANFMRDYFSGHGVAAINHLRDDDIDVILHVNPFPFLTPAASGYSFFDAYAYKIKHPQTIIVERVNECDERKGTHYVNSLLIRTAKHSDFVVYIASWLKDLLETHGLPGIIPSRVILNGGDTRTFNTNGRAWWDGSQKMRIVTHHWSNNPNKGHDAYQHLDEILGDASFSERFEFTYIGRVPPGVTYRNTTIIPPLTGTALAMELKRHHVYITASRNEPAGMHHIEAALCGLPILYINSGALPEYCKGFGIEFSVENLEKVLEEIRQEYAKYRNALREYPHTAERMGAAYLALIRELYAQRHIRSTTPFTQARALWFAAYSRVFSWWWIMKRALQRR
jgi:hypothetical protein